MSWVTDFRDRFFRTIAKAGLGGSGDFYFHPKLIGAFAGSRPPPGLNTMSKVFRAGFSWTEVIKIYTLTILALTMLIF